MKHIRSPLLIHPMIHDGSSKNKIQIMSLEMEHRTSEALKWAIPWSFANFIAISLFLFITAALLQHILVARSESRDQLHHALSLTSLSYHCFSMMSCQKCVYCLKEALAFLIVLKGWPSHIILHYAEGIDHCFSICLTLYNFFSNVITFFFLSFLCVCMWRCLGHYTF